MLPGRDSKGDLNRKKKNLSRRIIAFRNINSGNAIHCDLQQYLNEPPRWSAGRRSGTG